MEKLELKHLVPYLPYGLKMFVPVNGFKKSYHRINSVGINQVNWLLTSNRSKPILRPLSDLSSCIDGTVSEHSINTLIVEKYNVDYGMFSYYDGNIELEIEGDYDAGYDQTKYVSFDLIETIREELFKSHFDVFGLIKKGLAIDINTI